jgi:ficolin
MTTNGGGWTVFQRRQDGSENFARPWNDYAAGFGRLTGEFWLGNDNLVALTSSKQYRLRVDLRDWPNNTRYAEYSLFKVEDASTNYTLSSIGIYSGDAGDSLALHNGMKFTTIDRDNDVQPTINCAQVYHGGWWYRSCHQANLNGQYNSTIIDQGVIWLTWLGHQYSLRFTEMKIHPV